MQSAVTSAIGRQLQLKNNVSIQEESSTRAKLKQEEIASERVSGGGIKTVKPLSVPVIQLPEQIPLLKQLRELASVDADYPQLSDSGGETEVEKQIEESAGERPDMEKSQDMLLLIDRKLKARHSGKQELFSSTEFKRAVTSVYKQVFGTDEAG